MQITVNGMVKEVRDGLTVAELIAMEGEPADHVLVEINGVGLPFRRCGSRVLADGDRVEFILPAFGG